MGSFSLTRWLVVLAVVLILFGADCLPKAMGELARGMCSLDDASSEPAGERPVEPHQVTGSPQ